MEAGAAQVAAEEPGAVVALPVALPVAAEAVVAVVAMVGVVVEVTTRRGLA